MQHRCNTLKLLTVIVSCMQLQALQGYNMQQRIQAWKEFLSKPENHWQKLIVNQPVKNSNCGLVYELENFLQNPCEEFAIVDMCAIPFTEAHYHIHDEVEVYIVLHGKVCMVVGFEEKQISIGDAIITPSNTVHYVIPDNECVLAVINIPSFNPDNYVPMHKTDLAVSFDYEQFKRLVDQVKSKKYY
jgi:mannose-6-phosphate isomerase-like protein (cupin superfamily)